MASQSRKHRLGYAAVVAAGFFAGMIAGWWAPFAGRIDNYASDLVMRLEPAESWTPQSVVVAIDERTLSAQGGMRHIRPILAETLGKIAAAGPKAVALDVILHDQGDGAEDQQLAAALQATPNLILPVDLAATGKGEEWEEPLALFKPLAVGLGHVQLDVNRADGVSRQIPLEKIAQGQRRWALALEAFRISRGQPIVESPNDVQVGATLIPAARSEGDRPLKIRFLGTGIPTVSALEIDQHQDLVRGKTVFLGVTAIGANDRVVYPFGQDIPGVAVHAYAFEVMAHERFLVPASDPAVLGICAFFAIAAGITFALSSGWQSNAIAALLIIIANTLPIAFFRQGVIFPYFAPAAVAWLSTIGAATFQHFFVRRQLRTSESEKSRYQQAIHWAAHEMRTPLTAIQGSSEIMTRYALPEEKRHQLSEMINSESKRLARMIQTFLDVERLADGQMEIKREPFPLAGVVETCFTRVKPIAERKKIAVFLDTPVEGALIGDRELMEYAFYNLLTNAVKYSPSGTEIHVTAEQLGQELRLAVRDQGIGMDAKELKNIFKKFYRTRRAEASGEIGTGIGLSIVDQIVTHHGGRMEVTSEPEKGSCFTIVLRAGISTPSPNAEIVDRRR
jgi:signal transduction histidine kinase